MPEEIPLKKDMQLGDELVKKGSTVTALKIDKETYKVFHHTGWWEASSEYFE